MMSTQTTRRRFMASVAATGIAVSALRSPVAAQDTVEISYFSFSAGTEQQATLEAMVAAFEEANPGIKVKLESAPYGDYFTELQTRVAAGDAPDVYELNYENFVTFASRDILLDISEQLAADAALAEAIFPNARDAFQYDGKQFGLPSSFSNVLLFYNKDLFDAAGIDYPTADWTWAEELAAAEALTDHDAGIWGMNAPVAYNEFYKTAAQNGGAIIDADGNVTIDQPAVVEAVNFMVDPVLTLKVQPSEADLSGVGDSDLFMGGQLAMITTGIWMFASFGASDVNFDIALEPGNTTKAHHFFSNAIVVAKDTEKADAAFAFQSFMAGSPEVARLRIDANWELPPTTDQALLDSWISQTPPDSREVVFEALETLITPPTFTKQARVQDEVDAQLQQVLAGNLSAEDAMAQAKSNIEAILAE